MKKLNDFSVNDEVVLKYLIPTDVDLGFKNGDTGIVVETFNQIDLVLVNIDGCGVRSMFQSQLEKVGNSMDEEMTTISVTRYENLLSKEAHLEALKALGVEYWGGYVDAYVRCQNCSYVNAWQPRHCVSCGELLVEVQELFEKEA